MATLHIRDVPDEVQEAAKIAAIRRKQSLREFVIEALSEKLERLDDERPADPSS